ncbi:hypothetical protein ACYTPF_02405 [Alteromonas sp. HB246098]
MESNSKNTRQAVIKECMDILPQLRERFGQNSVYAWSNRIPQELAEKMKSVGIKSVSQSASTGSWFIHDDSEYSKQKSKNFVYDTIDESESLL